MSTIGSLIVKFSADIKDLTSGMDRVMKSTTDLGKFAKTSFDVGAKALTAMGTAASAVGVNATRMAMDFESSFAGVKKTIDGTEQDFATLSAGMRALAQEIPVNVNELNKIGETAGAMGIAKENVLEFTKVISMMGSTTNLTTDAAATAFGQMATLMNLTQADFQKLGSAIVDLGNKGESTEAQIADMAQRVVGAGKTVGLTTAEILALSATMANVGIESEKGGTAMSKLLIMMASDIAMNSDRLEGWAKVAGVSADQFATSFKTNAATAMQSFVEGLNKIQTSGGNLFGTLEELDIKEVRLRDTTMLLASAGGKLGRDLETSRTAWEKNTALTEEAGKRYETTASQLELYQNKLADTQITLGTALLPLFTKLLEASEPFIGILKSLADGFASLDPGSQMLIGTLTVVSSVFYPAVLAMGGFIGACKNLIPVLETLWALMLAHPFVAIAAAAAVLALAIYKNWDEIHDATVRLGKGFNAIIASGLDPVISAITRFRDTVISLCSQIYQGIKTYMQDKLLAIFGKVKTGIEEVKGYFKGLYEAVVGHSYIPDMVEEIGDHMRNLDVQMTAPARNAVVNTGHVIETGVMTWGATVNQFASNVNQTWGTLSSTLASNLARMTDETVNWGEVVKGIGLQVMTNLVTLFLGLATQWVASLVMQQTAQSTADAARVASHTAMETAKTAATTAGETARMAIAMTTNKVIMAGVISTLAGIGAVGNAALATMQIVVTTVSGIMAGIGAALVAGVFTAPIGASMIAASGALLATGSASVAAGVGVLQGALGAAIAMSTAAMATPFASGGIVTGATVGMMGEAGSEAAIPLNDRGARFMQNAFGMGSSGTIQNNIYIDGKLLTKTVAKHLHSVINTKLGYT
jgi:TP901 family phage tail tape measure protein